MNYANDDFWTAYSQYVEENWKRHASAIIRLGGFARPVLDLGCGQIMEGLRITRNGWEYLGIDKDEAAGIRNRYTFDYRTDFTKIVDLCDVQNYKPKTVLSLFSIETTGGWADNALLYGRIFRELPSVQKIISSGFYYEGQKEEALVVEAGGLQSYQSIGPLMTVEGMHEYRLLEHGPSKLFGPDVVEVWRLLERSRVC